MITVPAHQWMWSEHDVANHHFRRYSRAGVRALVEGAGLRVEVLTYQMVLLFPLMVLARFAAKLRGGGNSASGQLDVARLGRLLERIRGRITPVALARVSPFAVPVMLEIGREPVFGAAMEDILEENAHELIADFEDRFLEPGLLTRTVAGRGCTSEDVGDVCE